MMVYPVHFWIRGKQQLSAFSGLEYRKRKERYRFLILVGLNRRWRNEFSTAVYEGMYIKVSLSWCEETMWKEGGNIMKRLWDAGALLNKRYFLFIILLHSAVCAIIVQNALAFVLNLGLAYLVRGFLSLHFIVNGVESYKPTRKIGPFYILGDDHYFLRLSVSSPYFSCNRLSC